MVIPGYVDKALKEFQHKQPSRQHNSPYVAAPKRYGAKAQVMDNPEDFKEVTAAEKKFIQQVTGKLLCLGRAVDGTLLALLSVVASNQSSSTKDTLNRTKHFLDCVASQEDAVLTYHANNMVLAAHSDAG